MSCRLDAAVRPLSLPGSTLAEPPPARGGGARRRSAMLRRMKVTMLLADAASVADGTLDILGGG